MTEIERAARAVAALLLGSEGVRLVVLAEIQRERGMGPGVSWGLLVSEGDTGQAVLKLRRAKFL